LTSLPADVVRQLKAISSQGTDAMKNQTKLKRVS